MSCYYLQMGQPMPLPERIPMPNANLLKKMNEFGFIINNDGQHYVRYSVPGGWSLKNHSWREDLPDYYFVDRNNMARISITGSWKETYDNQLSIHIIDEPFSYEPRKEKVIPSETTASKIAAEFAEAFDPFHRPANTGN